MKMKGISIQTTEESNLFTLTQATVPKYEFQVSSSVYLNRNLCVFHTKLRVLLNWKTGTWFLKKWGY